jgi:hypothetical protein
MERLDRLLGAESDQHADHDDADFADKRTPTVQRLWYVDVHAAGPQQLRERNRQARVRNEGWADIASD